MLIDLFSMETDLLTRPDGVALVVDKGYRDATTENWGVTVRVLQRILALTATIWHNHHTGQPVLRSLIAYDH